MKNNQTTTALIAFIVFVFSGFVLYITRPVGGGLDTAGVALVGPIVGAVVASYFHLSTTGQAADISSAAVAVGVSAATTPNSQAPTGSTTTNTANFKAGG
jgi:hypothetical protein